MAAITGIITLVICAVIAGLALLGKYIVSTREPPYQQL